MSDPVKRNGSFKRKRRRIKLWHQQNGLCKFCSIPMIHWNDFANDAAKKTPEMQKRYATIDHLFDRLHPNRHDGNPNREERWVLSCWQCNFDRGKASCEALPKEELWRRSQRWPQKAEGASI